MMIIEPFKTFSKLVARAFYDDFNPSCDNAATTRTRKITDEGRRGVVVVVVEALTERQWVREKDLAGHLKLLPKLLRQVLSFLENEKMVKREQRRERIEGAMRPEMKYYCCLDYAQMYDVVRYRLNRMEKMLRDGNMQGTNKVQEYSCPNCGKRYNASDASQLISLEDESFHCNSCNGTLVVVSDDEDDDLRRRRIGALEKMEVQLKPLMKQINLPKDLDFPEFGTLQCWELEARANGEARGEESGGFRQIEIEVEIGSATAAVSQDAGEETDDKTSIEYEYLKAYYAPLVQKQEEVSKGEQILLQFPGTNCLSAASSDREVGKKSKRPDDEEAEGELNGQADGGSGYVEDDVEWEEG